MNKNEISLKEADPSNARILFKLMSEDQPDNAVPELSDEQINEIFKQMDEEVGVKLKFVLILCDEQEIGFSTTSLAEEKKNLWFGNVYVRDEFRMFGKEIAISFEEYCIGKQYQMSANFPEWMVEQLWPEGGIHI